MHARYGKFIYSKYGFLDSFNRSFTATDVKLSDGRVDPAFGWIANDYLGIDQGPILAMIGNYRNELVWDDMRNCAAAAARARSAPASAAAGSANAA